MKEEGGSVEGLVEVEVGSRTVEVRFWEVWSEASRLSHESHLLRLRRVGCVLHKPCSAYAVGESQRLYLPCT